MKYFEAHLNSDLKIDEIDISIHCDVAIFEWLMSFVHGENPNLTITNVVSILISAEFLQMQNLV